MAISDSQSPGDRLHLVQLSPGPAESRVARADAWRFCCAALTTRSSRRCADCTRRRDQSLSSDRDYLSDLPALLESGTERCGDANVLTSNFTGAVPRI